MKLMPHFGLPVVTKPGRVFGFGVLASTPHACLLVTKVRRLPAETDVVPALAITSLPLQDK
jgi:hypothetical protein